MVSPDDTRDSLQRYLEDIADSRPLSTEEEIALASRIRRGDMEARARLVEANLRFVITIARGYQNQWMPLEDLISAGNVGLVIAAERFDGTRGCRFISYAVWWIRQSILQTLKEHARLVRLPLNRVDLLHRIFLYIKTRQEDVSCSLDAEEIANALDMSVEIVRETLVLGQHILSLDAVIGDDDRDSLMERVADKDQESPDEMLMRHSLQEDIEIVLDSLEEREREIISLYYGLNGAPGMNLEEIGSKFGLTRERIRQIKEKALHKLRYPKRAQKLRPYAEEI